MITQSFGVYKTEEKLEDGSTIFYMHNKPMLKGSDTIWKMTADAFAVSTDGGKTWNAGMDSKGNAVVNVLSAIGIRFDWAKGGTLTLGGEKNVNGVLRILNAYGKEIGTWDKDGVHATNVEMSGNFSSEDIIGRGVRIKGGELQILKNNSVLASISATETSNANYCVFDVSGDKSVYLFEVNGTALATLSKNGMYISKLTSIPIIPLTKTGVAEFSDGSYLQYDNGLLIGGMTADGKIL